ncbi:O-antigen ligase family protein [Bizionia arctica]|uniref:O-antigen ligase-related domain-containing protein n=1 Tax=Bizionia arctica TaxID=1495645 RepID=A0A917GC62_9FLAO|nr:O-antigen ligase family protein [Bizionia arctica]GGG36530.1 hypothetical protein GCM10010976_05250 [Bizionia arctica]
MITKKHPLFIFLITTVIALIILGVYIHKHTTLLNSNVNLIQITLKNQVNKKVIPLVYIVKGNDEAIDFKKPYLFQKIIDSTYLAVLDTSSKVRKIRLYFNNPTEDLYLYDIVIKTKNEIKSVKLNDINLVGSLSLKKTDDKYSINANGKHSFIELPKTFIYTSDFKNIYQLVFPTLILLVLMVLVIKALKPIDIGPFTITSLTLSFLILSVFLPAPIYNIALILIAVLHLRNISWLAIKAQKINLIILGFFMLYMINNIFSDEGFKEISTIDRFLPFLVLAAVLPSIADRKYLSLFPISAFVLGFGFLLTSVFEVYIYQNFEFLSFDYFSKYLHPVYFSYLLFFSICFIDHNYKGKSKYFLEFVLLVFLIFSGSKMVFLLSLIVVFINLLKNKKTALLILPLVIIVILFSPLKSRFDEILKKEDFAILNENPIENSNDARVNGLTLRLLLWRESIATMSGLDYVFGKGVTKETNKILENRLVNLGLVNHKSFNPHNQYVDTFWRTGIIGLILLILIPVYSLVIGIKRKDKLIIQFSLFMFVVMFSESIFGRVNGVYFFATVILILMNSNKVNENSHIRN